MFIFVTTMALIRGLGMQKLRMICMSSVLAVSSSYAMEQSSMQLSVIEREIIDACGYGSFDDTGKKIIKENPGMVHKVYRSGFGEPCMLLHVAAEMDNIEAARTLLAAKASVNATTENFLYTPLHMVRSKKMAQLLLSYGASLENKDWKGATPLCYVLNSCKHSCGYYLLKRFDLDERFDLAHYLLKRGADINEPIDDKGNRLLHQAVGDKGASTVRFLLAHNANPASKNSGGKTPIEVGIFNWGNRKDEIKAFENCCITLLSRSNGACDELGDDAFELLIANNISLTTENKCFQ